MTDVIWLDGLKGGCDTVDVRKVRLDFRSGEINVPVEMPRRLMPKLAGLAFQLAAPDNPKSRGFSLAVESVDVRLHDMPELFVLSLGIGNGEAHFSLDRGQLGELLHLLKDVADNT